MPAAQRLRSVPFVVVDLETTGGSALFDRVLEVAAIRIEKRVEMPWDGEKLCTLRLSRRLIPGLHSYRLDSLCAFLGFTFVQRHRAGPDANATLEVLLHLLERARERGIETLGTLLRVQQQPVSRKRRRGRVDEAQVASL